MSSTKKGQPEPQSFLPLHPLETRILLVLLENESHGYRIVKEIERRETRWTKIFPANLYRRMRELLAKGLIDVADDVSTDTGRSRRVFRITALGSDVVREERHRLEALISDFRAADASSSGSGDR